MVVEGGSVILWIIVGPVLGSYLLTGAIFWYARRRSPTVIARRLARGRRVSIAVRDDRPAWNPSKPLGPGQGLRQAGTAIYSLDAAGLVHLDFVPLPSASSAGQGSLHVTGPMPDREGSPPAGASRAWWALALPPTALACGVVAGYTFSAGSGTSRLGSAVLWGVLLFLGAWITLHVLVIVRGARRPRQDQQPQ